MKWKHFVLTGPLCRELIPFKKANDAAFDVFFDLCLNKWLSKQSTGRWFETPSGHYDITVMALHIAGAGNLGSADSEQVKVTIGVKVTCEK